MIKYIILLFNLMGLFLYQLFFQANVSATQNVPSSAAAGSSFVVTVTINKADVSGFAKYQEDLPAGFTATAVDKQGATVLSSDNAIKFIWASLPSDATVTISFKITVDASVSGSQSLSGKFLYVVNNERQEADVAASSISISGGTTPVTTTTTAPTTDTTKQTSVAVTTTTTTTPVSTETTQPTTTPVTTTTTQPVTTTTAPSSSPSVNVSRTYSAYNVTPASDLIVSITVHKGNLSGFAKLEESIPDNLIVTAGDNQGASFTFVDNKAKFVWLSLPTDSVFTISYKISVGSVVSGNQTITGEFSYLVDNNANKVQVAPTSFMVQANQPIATTTQPATVATTQSVTPTTTETTIQPTTTQPIATTTQPTTTTPTTDMSTAVTPHITGGSEAVKYRVQIMALHNPIKSSYLAKKFNITETINQEMLEGYTKYTVGRFNDYKAVHDHREEIKSKGVEGPFVVAYSGGKRITVQEALMITHQQWYQ